MLNRRTFLKWLGVGAAAPSTSMALSLPEPKDGCGHDNAFCRDNDRVGTMYCPDCKQVITLTMRGLRNSSESIQGQMTEANVRVD